MRKFLKIVGYLVLVLVIVVGGLIGYVKVALPNVGAAPEMKVTSNAERVERGRYLANCVTVCMDCHSTRDWTKFSGPIAPGTLGKGGERFDRELGFPGIFYSRNITPKGIGRYTDGELYRVITTGVNKEGHAMFPVMPYPYYSSMDPEDIQSIIAYIRTLDPIDNDPPASAADFPMSIIMNMIPKAAQPGKRPDSTDVMAYGKYLVNAAGCIECHTQAEKGQIIKELAFSGGREFQAPWGTIRSSNITPSEKTGIGTWSKEAFINRFKSYAKETYTAPTVEAGAFNTIMPWTMYANMTTTDLGAIYTYIHSLPAKENTVEKFTAKAVASK